MIQRPQTVYLLLSIIVCIVALCSGNICEFTEAQLPIAHFSNFTLSAGDRLNEIGPWALGTVLILVILINLMATLLFRFRMRQLRLLIFTTLLLIGYCGAYAFFAWLYSAKLGEGTEVALRWPAILPLLAIIFNCMAIHHIRKDEALVRSIDRIR